jgi:hypothetical protein
MSAMSSRTRVRDAKRATSSELAHDRGSDEGARGAITRQGGFPMNEETKTASKVAPGPEEVVTMSAPRPIEMAAKKGGKGAKKKGGGKKKGAKKAAKKAGKKGAKKAAKKGGVKKAAKKSAKRAAPKKAAPPAPAPSMGRGEEE